MGRAADQSEDSIASIAVARMVRLRRHGITVVVVADCPVTSPAKEEERARRRDAKNRASLAVDDPNHDDVPRPDVHGRLQTTVLEALRREGLTVVMAPAEADHQLAVMCDEGDLDGVITVDSNLLVLGAAHVYVNLKGDGSCLQIRLADLWRPVRNAAADLWTRWASCWSRATG
jgi:exonuclease-1